MSSVYADPYDHFPLKRSGNELISPHGKTYPIIHEIPRFCDISNYTSSFGLQWNKFRKTQLDGEGVSGSPSATRFFAETGWSPGELQDLDILEVGSGAGRFSRVVLQQTQARLFSVDYSTAVEANYESNVAYGSDRFFLAQASIYELPFADGRFDRIFCLGVLQHTPDFEESVRSLVKKAKPGGEIVVDFYPIKGFWTKIHAKYILRPITKRIQPDLLLSTVEKNVDWMIAFSNFLGKSHLGALRRFIPLADFRNAMPKGLSESELREWVVLDTFDMLSPEFDNPQRISSVAKMFERAGASVTFAGFVDNGSGHAAVVRARRL